MGHVILESMIWFDLIWFDLTRHSKSHWKQHSLWKEIVRKYNRFTSNKYIIVKFIYSYNVDADGLRDFIFIHSYHNVINNEIYSKSQCYIPSNKLESINLSNISKLCVYDCNDDENTRFHLNYTCLNLQTLVIGPDCCFHVSEFVLDGLPELESVKIGKRCFRKVCVERDDGLCQITNCPNLRQLEIGYYSFEYYKSFELSNVNSLQSIDFGNWCFGHADFSLNGEWKERRKCDLNDNENDVLDLPSLESVTFRKCSFKYCHVAVFESMWWLFIFISFLILDLPKLHTITFINGFALTGDDRENCETMIKRHESYDNTLIMKSKLNWNEMWIVLWW